MAICRDGKRPGRVSSMDPVVGPGVGEVTRFEERQLPGRDVGDGPQPGQIGDASVAADTAVSLDRRESGLLGDQHDDVADLLGDGERHAVLHAPPAEGCPWR